MPADPSPPSLLPVASQPSSEYYVVVITSTNRPRDHYCPIWHEGGSVWGLHPHLGQLVRDPHLPRLKPSRL